MKIPNPSGLFNIGRSFVAANRPEILFGASLVSTVSGVILAAKGGWDARGQVDEVNAERAVAGEPQLNRKEIAQLTWINYLPAAGATGISLGSTTGLHLVHVKEKKQLAAAAILAMEQVKKDAIEYKKDVLESLGVAKSEDVKELDRASKKSGVAKVVHSDGEIEELYLVRDRKSGRDVYSNKQRISEAVLDLNRQLMNNEAVDLNTFYGYAGYGSIPDGEVLGWNAGEQVELQWKTSEIRDDGRPVRVFDFLPHPTEGFDRSYG